MKSEAARCFRAGVLPTASEAGGSRSLARVCQKPDGLLEAEIESDEPAEALGRLRFILAAAADLWEFLRRFRDDPLIGKGVRDQAGMRPIRTASVTHALLKAVCGQLIRAKAARMMEPSRFRLACPELRGLRLPPRRETFQAFSRAHLARHGLVSRKA